MPKMIQRKYRCGECSHEWTGLHYKKTEPNESCPQCAANAPGAPDRVNVHERDGLNEIISARIAPAYSGARVHSKALDMCGKMLEDDYGIPPSLINDQARQGDCYVKTPASMTQPSYMGVAGSTKEVTESFLAQARAGGALGENGLDGFQIAKGAANSGVIPDPRKNMIQLGTKD
jgi:DNA-directed RNA polymerase subunit RPC12/RpoP